MGDVRYLGLALEVGFAVPVMLVGMQHSRDNGPRLILRAWSGDRVVGLIRPPWYRRAP